METAASVPDSDNPVDYEDIKERVSKNYYDLSGKKVLMDDSTFGEIWIPALENVPAFSREKVILNPETEGCFMSRILR